MEADAYRIVNKETGEFFEGGRVFKGTGPCRLAIAHHIKRRVWYQASTGKGTREDLQVEERSKWKLVPYRLVEIKTEEEIPV